METPCDHTSVGMFVWKGDELLLIERAKFPKTFSIPAGHVDEHESYEHAARRELMEEVGLEAESLELVLEGRKENACRRDGGTWHHWKLYRVEATGEVVGSSDETKGVDWFSKEELTKLAERTEKYNAGLILESEWEESPGLEPVMYEWFKELDII